MELHLSRNKNNYIKKSSDAQNFINDLSNFLDKNNKDLDIDEYRKEGHLYLVTEDRDGIVFLWDFTEKSKEAFEVDDLPPELQKVATEGAMLQYTNGEFILYSENGYDMVYGEDE